MSQLAIEVRGLRKRYGELQALRGVDLSVRQGEVYALLGPNGAGKTTTVEILEGHRSRTAGEVRVLGYDPESAGAALRRRTGIVLQSTGVEPYLTVEEAVELFRGYYPAPRPLDEVLALVGLREERKVLVRRLSAGQQRRLDVAIGLAGDPELLFLDEPTSGFDPSARRSAWQMVKSLQALGKTIFLTTHYLDEAQYLADRVAIMVRGEIVAEGAPDSLDGAQRTTSISFRLPGAAAELPEALRGLAHVDNGLVRIETGQPTRTLHALTRWATERGIELEALAVSPGTLEEQYLRITGALEVEAPE